MGATIIQKSQTTDGGTLVELWNTAFPDDRLSMGAFIE